MHVILRPLRVDDVNDTYLGWLHDPEVTRHLEVRHDPPNTLDELRQFVASFDATDQVLFGIHVDGRHVGNVAVRSSRYETASVAFMVGDRASWGRGIAGTAVQQAVAFAFDELGVRKVHGAAYASNVASRRIFERLGFREEGRLRRHVLVEGQADDVIHFGLLSDER